ncbi:EamA family transporter RarD [Herbaspirillum sp. GCM10030257]|uniref:EamA family transporter RarD n=1 Tax=Herbaspirillum sp. GCM10030257 TaxID=3273393 RepID=UPI00361EFCEC
MNIGMLYAATAYALWGIFPLYFKSLQEVPPLEILLHRMVWSLAFVVVVLAWRRHWGWLRGVMRQPKVLAGFAASAVLLSSNWFIYIWAVNNGNVVEASLGYFINPLFNVLLGSLLLRERLRVVQWMAVALAACGVAWLTWHGGHLPWIALLLAATFAFYGLLRKTASLGALEGLALETLLLFPVAFIYLAVLASQGHNSFITASTSTQLLLAAAGPITAIPLLLFAAGARRIPLSLLGLLQYIGPTIQLLLGVWLYHEPFGGARLAGFALIWGALAVYSLEGLWQAWSRKASSA